MAAQPSERAGKFWCRNVIKLKEVEKEWFSNFVMKELLDRSYNMSDSKLDQQLERTVGNRIVLLGPMLDDYLQEIGQSMQNKLKGHLTGLATPVKMFIPYQVANQIVALFTGYGADVNFVSPVQVKKERIVIFITKKETAHSVFHPKRFNGSNFLCKRKFGKQLVGDGGKQKSVCQGVAKVVISHFTPMKVDYHVFSQQCFVYFFIQRYDANNFAIDANLQALMNQPKPNESEEIMEI